MASGFKRADTGINTVEGTVAGSRAAFLSKQRDKEQQAYEAKKRKIEEENRKYAQVADMKAVPRGGVLIAYVCVCGCVVEIAGDWCASTPSSTPAAML